MTRVRSPSPVRGDGVKRKPPEGSAVTLLEFTDQNVLTRPKSDTLQSLSRLTREKI
mgnify:CR=1 FL=1